MVKPAQDRWAQWLLHRRHGGDPEAHRATLEAVRRFRDRVLHEARIRDRDTVLDVGTGDGLVAFGALDRVGTQGRVIFSDISQDLLDHVQALAEQLGVLDRCQFLRASADDLSALANASVDVVTTRSVLIYVAAKEQAFREFHRVLRPGGRLSIFEPINGYFLSLPEEQRGGYDMTPVRDLTLKVAALYQHLQPPESNPMLGFDERDLLRSAEAAGFAEVHLELQVAVTPRQPQRWETYIATAGNPLAPTLAEAIAQALTPDEAARYAAHLRPLVEHGEGVNRSAAAYLWATKR